MSASRILSTRARAALFAVGATTAGTIAALERRVHAGEVELHPMRLPWGFNGMTQGLDYGSVRRGYQVYKQVCAACHSLRFIYYRHFVNVFMTEEEAKAEAAEALVDCLDDAGKPAQRPGTLTDGLPAPYKNDKVAMAANNGALPPDLSVITLGRHGGADYIFSLLTGYVDTPEGIKVDEGKAYNPYFPGCIIGMPQQLYDEGIEYDDGTPATMSQQAKDVCEFLTWTAEPYFDQRKQWGWKGLLLMTPLVVLMWYWKKHTWSFLKTQQFAWRTVKGREPPKVPQ